MEPAQRDDYLKELAAAGAAGGAAYIATLLSGDLPLAASATMILLATLAGWAIGRIITHKTRRLTNAVLACTLVVASSVVGVVSLRERCAPKGIMCLVGGCDQYSVYVQNRWEPYGAALRTEPRRDATQIGSYDPNQLIPVNGWVRTSAAYPHNPPPFNNDVWFHVAPDRGWVSMAGVRADPTRHEVDSPDEGDGAPAPTPGECRGTFRSNN